MAFCPYCGESIADDAVQCGRCGMVLDEDAAAVEVEAAEAEAAAPEAGAPAAAEAEAPPRKKTEPCPHCGEPVPVRSHRCPICSRAIRAIVDSDTRAAEARFRRNVKLGAAGAVGLLAILILAAGFLGGNNPPKRPDYVRIRFDELSSLVGPGARSSSRQAEIWNRYAGKYVRWEGKIVRVERAGLLGGDGALLIRESDGPGDPEVRLSLPASELSKKGVASGARVTYSGRLDAYGGSPAFTLADGQVLSP